MSFRGKVAKVAKKSVGNLVSNLVLLGLTNGLADSDLHGEPHGQSTVRGQERPRTVVLVPVRERTGTEPLR